MSLQNRNKISKMILFALLYTSQMLGMSFLITALPSILREMSLDLEKIGWVYGLGFIWSLKFLWAPFIDKFGSEKIGHYKGWIIICQFILILIFINISFLQIDENLSILIVFFALIAFFSSIQDIASDALNAVDLRHLKVSSWLPVFQMEFFILFIEITFICSARSYGFYTCKHKSL